MKRFLLFLLALPLALVLAPVLASSPLVAQTVNLFDWSRGQVVPKTEFLTLGYLSVPDYRTSPKVSIYETFPIAVGTGTYQVKIGGLSRQPDPDGLYDMFYILDRKGNTILSRKGYDPLFTTRYLTMDYSKREYFIKVPLDDESFALIFGGWLFQFDDGAVEMVVVVVSNDKATVVFDSKAFAYKYTAPPNFSMAFTDDAHGLLDSEGKYTITEAALKPHNKYKIWREGNLLKYKRWK